MAAFALSLHTNIAKLVTSNMLTNINQTMAASAYWQASLADDYLIWASQSVPWKWNPAKLNQKSNGAARFLNKTSPGTGESSTPLISQHTATTPRLSSEEKQLSGKVKPSLISTPPVTPEKQSSNGIISSFDTACQHPLSPIDRLSILTGSPPESIFIPESPPSTTTTHESSPSSPPLFITENFEARASPKGGYGAFALQKITAGTVILSEYPLINCPDDGNGYFYQVYDGLSTEDRKAFLELASWSKIDDDPVTAIWKTNRFRLDQTHSGLFLKASRFNHACLAQSSCYYRWDRASYQMHFTSMKDIAKGEEITVSYAISPDFLYEDYGFFCDCKACPTLSAGEKLRKKSEVESKLSSEVRRKW
ncbi:hypothetical protein BP6252_07263 [Coleophoma cylindrospora]|uniref:SET domain-containing protein n=1 Tax=Coleophoma cylindrospora TaxID=1849047 RepID=A0A3D8RHC9_9HELO|nr:hypothetical protein BP6252_07263 [Coleophoma cylindrospora]